MSTPSRPLSPHLGIYRRQHTMVLSVLHRATGLALSAGLLGLTLWLLAVAAGPDSYRPLAALLASAPGCVLLAGFTAAFWYHFVAGIRHLVFDTGHALERREARRSAIVVVVAALALTAATLLLVLRARGLA
jgi:succinate dehydrogenase / fumarate reductase cytochrome b subunit